MLRTILIGLDGSPHSHSATEFGIQLAKEFGAMLIGLGVIDEPGITEGIAVPLGGAAYKQQRDQHLTRESRNRVERYLSEFSIRCASEGVSSKILEEVGYPVDQINLHAQRYDLILLGQKTHFRFDSQDDPCTTLRDVLQVAPRPVITSPAQLAKGTNVVVAYDGSLQSARALAAFQSTGIAERWPVHLVAVNPDFGEASRHLNRASEFLAFHHVRAIEHPVVSSDFQADVLLAKAKELDARLMVMGAYGKSMLVEFFLGSVTKSVLAEANVPLFLAH